MPVLVSTVAVNTTTCIAKDRAFARMFGAIKPAPVPALTYALWLTRDSIVMGAAFTLPPVLSSWMQVGPTPLPPPAFFPPLCQSPPLLPTRFYQRAP